MKRYGALLLLVAILAGCGGGSSKPKTAPTRQITGTVKVDDASEIVARCNPGARSAGDDLAPGGTITVYNASGTIVATPTLGPMFLDGRRFGNGTCNMAYSAIVPVSAFYQVDVGSGNKVTFQQSEIGHADISVS